MEDTIIQHFFVKYRAKSTNYYYSKSFHERKKHKDILKFYMLKAIEDYNIKSIPEDYYITIEWQPILYKEKGIKDREYDIINNGACIKMIEDYLTTLEIIKNDDSRYVIGHKINKTIVQDKIETGYLCIMTAIKKENYINIDQEYLKMI